jgi:hypothetical protein
MPIPADVRGRFGTFMRIWMDINRDNVYVVQERVGDELWLIIWMFVHREWDFMAFKVIRGDMQLSRHGCSLEAVEVGNMQQRYRLEVQQEGGATGTDAEDFDGNVSYHWRIYYYYYYYGLRRALLATLETGDYFI